MRCCLLSRNSRKRHLREELSEKNLQLREKHAEVVEWRGRVEEQAERQLEQEERHLSREDAFEARLHDIRSELDEETQQLQSEVKRAQHFAAEEHGSNLALRQIACEEQALKAEVASARQFGHDEQAQLNQQRATVARHQSIAEEAEAALEGSWQNYRVQRSENYNIHRELASGAEQVMELTQELSTVRANAVEKQEHDAIEYAKLGNQLAGAEEQLSLSRVQLRISESNAGHAHERVGNSLKESPVACRRNQFAKLLHRLQAERHRLKELDNACRASQEDALKGLLEDSSNVFECMCENLAFAQTKVTTGSGLSEEQQYLQSPLDALRDFDSKLQARTPKKLLAKLRCAKTA